MNMMSCHDLLRVDGARRTDVGKADVNEVGLSLHVRFSVERDRLDLPKLLQKRVDINLFPTPVTTSTSGSQEEARTDTLQ
jgi:hypothetical protein